MTSARASILVIDDEQGIRTLLNNELSAQGYVVDVAGDGEEGVARIRQGKYDVVITDVKMPKGDGVQVLHAARAYSPGTEIIIITGFATVKNAVAAMKQGAYDFIQKPFDIDELSALVEKAVEKRELKALVALYESSKAVFSAVTLEELFPVMLDLLKKALRADDVALLLRDFQGQPYLAAASFSLIDYPDRDSFVSLVERMPAGGPAMIITRGTETGAKLLEGLFRDSAPHSLIAYPLRLKDQDLGMLLLTRAAGEFNLADTQNLSVFASQIAQSIATARLYEKLYLQMAELERLKQR